MNFYGMPCGRQPQGQQPLFPPSPAIGTTLPTGMPTGPMPTPMPMPAMTGAAGQPSVTALPTLDTGFVAGQAPQTVQDVFFTPGFLRTQIGRRMRVEFLIGTGTLVDRTGTLIGVGASYILLRLVDSDDIMMCDIYSIKFATILL